MATPASTSSGQAPAMAGMASSSTSETSCWQCCCCRRKCSTGAGHGISNPAGHQRTGYCQTPAHLSPTPHHGYHPCSHASHAILNHYQTRPATETVEGVGPSASSDTTTSPYDANWCTLCASRIGGISPMQGVWFCKACWEQCEGRELLNYRLMESQVAWKGGERIARK